MFGNHGAAVNNQLLARQLEYDDNVIITLNVNMTQLSSYWLLMI